MLGNGALLKHLILTEFPAQKNLLSVVANADVELELSAGSKKRMIDGIKELNRDRKNWIKKKGGIKMFADANTVQGRNYKLINLDTGEEIKFARWANDEKGVYG
jgi:hypothetical protein